MSLLYFIRIAPTSGGGCSPVRSDRRQRTSREMPATAPYLLRRSKSDSSRSSASLGGSSSCFAVGVDEADAVVEARFTGRALLGGGGGRGESGIGPALVAPGLSRLLTVSLRLAIARRPIAAADEDEDDDDDEEGEEEEDDDDDGSGGGDGDSRGFLAGVSASCGACLFCLRLPSALVPSPCDTR